MNLNVDKCAAMHICLLHNGELHNYTMENQQLKATEERLDLGITITKKLNLQKQTEKIVRQQAEYYDSLPATSTTKAQSSCSHSTSLLSNPTWNMQPSNGRHILRGDIDKMKRVQKKTTKMFQRSEAIATNNSSRSWNSLALYKADFEGNLMRCTNI